MTLKRDDFFRDPHLVAEYLRQQNQYELNQKQEVRLALRVDESVGPAMFRPDPLIPGGYVANSLTLRAVRQDIFLAGDSFDDLAVERPCGSCSKSIDHQFWRLCPYCARPLASS